MRKARKMNASCLSPLVGGDLYPDEVPARLFQYKQRDLCTQEEEHNVLLTISTVRCISNGLYLLLVPQTEFMQTHSPCFASSTTL